MSIFSTLHSHGFDDFRDFNHKLCLYFLNFSYYGNLFLRSQISSYSSKLTTWVIQSLTLDFRAKKVFQSASPSESLVLKLPVGFRAIEPEVAVCNIRFQWFQLKEVKKKQNFFFVIWGMHNGYSRRFKVLVLALWYEWTIIIGDPYGGSTKIYQLTSQYWVQSFSNRKGAGVTLKFSNVCVMEYCYSFPALFQCTQLKGLHLSNLPSQPAVLS